MLQERSEHDDRSPICQPRSWRGYLDQPECYENRTEIHNENSNGDVERLSNADKFQKVGDV